MKDRMRYCQWRNKDIAFLMAIGLMILCYLIPLLISKFCVWSVNGGETKWQIEMARVQDQEVQDLVNRKVEKEKEIVNLNKIDEGNAKGERSWKGYLSLGFLP